MQKFNHPSIFWLYTENQVCKSGGFYHPPLSPPLFLLAIENLQSHLIVKFFIFICSFWLNFRQLKKKA